MYLLRYGPKGRKPNMTKGSHSLIDCVRLMNSDIARSDRLSKGHKNDIYIIVPFMPFNGKYVAASGGSFYKWHDRVIRETQFPTEQESEMLTDRFTQIRSKTEEMVHQFGSQSNDDLEAARAIATAAIETYGDFDETVYQQFKERGIWNDHVSVQAALVAIRMMRAGTI